MTIIAGDIDKYDAVELSGIYLASHADRREISAMEIGAKPQGLDNGFPPFFIATASFNKFHDFIKANHIGRHNALHVDSHYKLAGLYSGTVILAPGYEQLPLEFFTYLSTRTRTGGLKVEYAYGYQPVTDPDNRDVLYFNGLNEEPTPYRTYNDAIVYYRELADRIEMSREIFR